MLVELGKKLSKRRKNKGVSLKTVAGMAGISDAYLHKLERGVVNDPSPRVLARISVALDIPYLRLLELAGYLDEKQFAEIQMRETSPEPHPLAGQKLTSEEWREVGEFIKGLVGKRKQ